LDGEIQSIELLIPRIIQLKAGEIEPERCETCDYCKSTKVLTGPIHYTEITQKI